MLLKSPWLPLQTYHTTLHPHFYFLALRIGSLQSLRGLHWKINKLQWFWIPWSAGSCLSIHPSRNGPSREQLRPSFAQGGCCKVKLGQGWQIRAQHWGKRVKDTPHSVKYVKNLPQDLKSCFRKFGSLFLALKVLSSEEKIPVHIADFTIHHSVPFLHLVVMLLEDTETLEI